MARFLIMVKSSGDALTAYEAGAQPDLALVQAMMKFNEELVKAGAWISGEGLHPSTKGAKVKYAKGKATFVDGPFSEAKELIGGFWLVRFANKQACLDMLATCPLPDGEIEIREIFDIGDRPDDIKAPALEFAEKLATT
jgi:hypothetical protein